MFLKFTLFSGKKEKLVIWLCDFRHLVYCSGNRGFNFLENIITYQQ